MELILGPHASVSNPDEAIIHQAELQHSSFLVSSTLFGMIRHFLMSFQEQPHSKDIQAHRQTPGMCA